MSVRAADQPAIGDLHPHGRFPHLMFSGDGLRLHAGWRVLFQRAEKSTRLVPSSAKTRYRRNFGSIAAMNRRLVSFQNVLCGPYSNAPLLTIFPFLTTSLLAPG